MLIMFILMEAKPSVFNNTKQESYDQISNATLNNRTTQATDYIYQRLTFWMFKTEYDVNVTLVLQLVTWTHVIHHEIDKKQILYIKSTNRLRTPKPLGYQIRITRKI